MLAGAYLTNGWKAMALLMARRYVAQSPAGKQVDTFRELITNLEELVALLASQLGLEGADAVECMALHEQVRSLLSQGRYARARDAADELIGRRPRFAPAYNNAAEASFHDGRLARAIEVQQRLLAMEPHRPV